MAGRVPLARTRDGFIERWLKPAPGTAPPTGGRVPLPGLGKPPAVRRGTARLAGGSGSPYRRRATVIVSFHRLRGAGYAKLHAHLRYVERPGAGERAVAAELFSAGSDGVPGHERIAAWRDDRHQFRVILAPEDGHRLDMTAYTRAFMAELEAALGTRLEWVAGIHEKADAAHPRNRHAHIVIRGVDDTGADLVIGREFIRHGMRRIAEELATRQLGQMSQRELDAHLARRAERAGERVRAAGRRGDGRGHD
ncbi:hypothetical protein JL101_032470 (plasmid) [Skermanella rosea]|uniref:hypothetical protein n=1 Tax=Skermanella rosea TaxID=1817965 RepID=UPI001932CD85|nr:hypothetical protein [Skermanella rosea]UEM07629.1 hypothetical protein JL101_032470 [Skermanella rosea]